MRKSSAVIVALFALASIQITYYYPHLPVTLASHFNAAGVANDWQPKWAFFTLYVVVLGVVTLPSLLISRLIVALPSQFINLPNKQYWLAPERRAATAEYFHDHIATLCAAVLALLIGVFQLTIIANLPGASGSLSWTVWPLLASFFVFALLWAGALIVRFRRI